jgi:hypothetical protein
MPWDQRFSVPIALLDGRTIATLSDAREMMLSLSPSQRRLAVWRFASLMLIDAAFDNGRLEQAELLFTRALKAERLLEYPATASQPSPTTPPPSSRSSASTAGAPTGWRGQTW